MEFVSCRARKVRPHEFQERAALARPSDWILAAMSVGGLTEIGRQGQFAMARHHLIACGRATRISDFGLPVYVCTHRA